MKKKYLVLTISDSGQVREYFNEYRLAANYRDICQQNGLLALLMQLDEAADDYYTIA